MTKQLFVCLAMLCVYLPIKAQVITSLSSTDSNRFDRKSEEVNLSLQVQYTGGSTGQARAKKMYGRWESFWSLRASHNTPDTMDRSIFSGIMLDQFLKGTLGVCLGGTDNSNWTCVGPFRNSFGQSTPSCQKTGRINALWIDPDDQNYILAGAAAGGIWKTTDGGQNWNNITDQSQEMHSTYPSRKSRGILIIIP